MLAPSHDLRFGLLYWVEGFDVEDLVAELGVRIVDSIEQSQSHGIVQEGGWGRR